MPNTKIIVFGANGQTGHTIVERGIKEGYDITTFGRNPSKMPEILRNKVKVIQGDVFNREQVEDAIKGHDVVLSALGTGSRGITGTVPVFVMTNGARNIVSGMKKYKVKKLVVVSGAINLPNHWVPWFARQIKADHDRMLKILEEEKEDIDWVSLHPPMLNKSMEVNPGYILEKNDMTGRSFVNTGEIADFMMRFIQNQETCEEYRHNLVGISSGPARITNSQLQILAALVVLVAAGLITRHFKFI